MSRKTDAEPKQKAPALEPQTVQAKRIARLGLAFPRWVYKNGPNGEPNNEARLVGCADEYLILAAEGDWHDGHGRALEG